MGQSAIPILRIPDKGFLIEAKIFPAVNSLTSGSPELLDLHSKRRKQSQQYDSFNKSQIFCSHFNLNSLHVPTASWHNLVFPTLEHQWRSNSCGLPPWLTSSLLDGLCWDSIACCQHTSQPYFLGQFRWAIFVAIAEATSSWWAAWYLTCSWFSPSSKQIPAPKKGAWRIILISLKVKPVFDQTLVTGKEVRQVFIEVQHTTIAPSTVLCNQVHRDSQKWW